MTVLIEIARSLPIRSVGSKRGSTISNWSWERNGERRRFLKRLHAPRLVCCLYMLLICTNNLVRLWLVCKNLLPLLSFGTWLDWCCVAMKL